MLKAYRKFCWDNFCHYDCYLWFLNMIITKKIIEQKEIEVIENIFCSSCKCSCKFGTNRFEYALLSVDWGWDSSQPDINYKLYLCEKCTNSVIKYLKIDFESVFERKNYDLEQEPDKIET